jgi:hypothetical protein
MIKKFISLGILFIILVVNFGLTTSAIKTVGSNEEIQIINSSLSGTPDFVIENLKCTWNPIKKDLIVYYEEWNRGETYICENGKHCNTSIVVDGELITTHHVKVFNWQTGEGWGFKITFEVEFEEKPTEVNVTIDCFDEINEIKENNNYAVTKQIGIGLSKAVSYSLLMKILDTFPNTFPLFRFLKNII